MQLINLLSKDGLLDSKTKKNFENINNGIQQLISESKKKRENQEVVLDSKTKQFFETMNKNIQQLLSKPKKK